MKNMLSLLLVTALVVVFASSSFAMSQAVEKLKGGVTEVIMSPLEVKDHAMAEAKPGSFLPLSLPGGLLKGTFYMVKKAVGGALDIATFPIH